LKREDTGTLLVGLNKNSQPIVLQKFIKSDTIYTFAGDFLLKKALSITKCLKFTSNFREELANLSILETADVICKIKFSKTYSAFAILKMTLRQRKGAKFTDE